MTDGLVGRCMLGITIIRSHGVAAVSVLVQLCI